MSVVDFTSAQPLPGASDAPPRVKGSCRPAAGLVSPQPHSFQTSTPVVPPTYRCIKCLHCGRRGAAGRWVAASLCHHDSACTPGQAPHARVHPAPALASCVTSNANALPTTTCQAAPYRRSSASLMDCVQRSMSAACRSCRQAAGVGVGGGGLRAVGAGSAVCGVLSRGRSWPRTHHGGDTDVNDLLLHVRRAVGAGHQRILGLRYGRCRVEGVVLRHCGRLWRCRRWPHPALTIERKAL